jgi:hypothetical protein
MTRTHAAYQLLRHGPLDLQEFQEITGWKYWACVRALHILRQRGQVLQISKGSRPHPSVYEVVA